MLIPISFVHDSLPPGGQRADLPAIPRKEEVVRLNDRDFIVKAVAHVVSPPVEGDRGTYIVFVYLITLQEFMRHTEGRD